MAAEREAFVLDVGRRRQLANRVLAGYGFAAGGILFPLGALGAAGVGYLPRTASVIMVVGGLVATTTGRSILRRNRGIASEDRLVIDQDGVRIEGKDGWAYTWSEITRVKAYYVPAPGQMDQIVTLFGPGRGSQPGLPDSELVTCDLGWSWRGVLPGVVEAVNRFGPGRYEPGRRPTRPTVRG